MRTELGLDIPWRTLLPELLPVEHGASPAEIVDIEVFLACCDPRPVDERAAPDDDAVEMVLSAHHRDLGAVFLMLDTDGDGVLSRNEFEVGCQVLNSTLATAQQFDAMELFNLIDADGSGTISLDEFSEMAEREGGLK